MRKMLDLEIIEGKLTKKAIRIHYQYPKKLTAENCRGYISSELTYCCGESLLSETQKSTPKDNRIPLKEYIFIDFILSKSVKRKNEFGYKTGAVLFDIKDSSILKGEINFAFINKNIIFAVGKMDFLKKEVYMECYKNNEIRILGFKK